MSAVLLGHAFLIEPAWAEDVSYGQNMRVSLPNGDAWRWQVDFFEGVKTLKVWEGGVTKPSLSADVSDCSFCGGDGDNCLEDGIKILQVSRYPNPIVQVVCHVGAHSQRLMIFDAEKDGKAPVFQRTGVYWINVKQKKHHISIAYDKSGFASLCPDRQPSADGVCEIHENWPSSGMKFKRAKKALNANGWDS